MRFLPAFLHIIITSLCVATKSVDKDLLAAFLQSEGISAQSQQQRVVQQALPAADPAYINALEVLKTQLDKLRTARMVLKDPNSDRVPRTENRYANPPNYPQVYKTKATETKHEEPTNRAIANTKMGIDEVRSGSTKTNSGGGRKIAPKATSQPRVSNVVSPSPTNCAIKSCKGLARRTFQATKYDCYNLAKANWVQCGALATVTTVEFTKQKGGSKTVSSFEFGSKNTSACFLAVPGCSNAPDLSHASTSTTAVRGVAIHIPAWHEAQLSGG